MANAKSKWKNKNERLLALLRRDRFGNALGDTTRHVLNLSDYVLSATESFVLSHGLNFGLPPRHLCKEEIFAEFESLWAQLLHDSASSVEQRTALKARLADLAHLYSDSTIDSRDFTMNKECFRAINRLRKNDDIVMQEASDAHSKTADSDTVSTYQVSSVQLVTDKKLEAFNKA